MNSTNNPIGGDESPEKVGAQLTDVEREKYWNGDQNSALDAAEEMRWRAQEALTQTSSVPTGKA